ncbi:MAG: hydantoinase/oxoprolinase family protein [Solirubrobacterales bacterium]
MSSFVGVDIGGTFTDLVAVDEDSGVLTVRKVPSTPPTFIEGILNGLGELGMPFSDIRLLVHGSTIGTNAVLERKGAKTALVTTKGFRDVLTLARATKPDTYDLRWQPPDPLVKRRNIFDVTERMNHKGEVVTALDTGELKALKSKFEARDIEAIAVCFLNSFINPEHERLAAEVLRDLLPDVRVSTSYDVFPEIREFERTSTTVVNAYLQPVTDRYLGDLMEGLGEGGFDGDLLIVHSGGGVMTEETARKLPARMCYSGPAGGVQGGAYIGGLADRGDVITMDMGGTSTDVAVVKNGRPVVSPGLSIEHNIPVRFPSIDIATIGAGGGSIGWIDRGLLKNGPESAGANPGPACYGRGGDRPTNTDANIALGRVSEAGLIGGALPLDRARAAEVIDRDIAGEFGWSTEEAASAILRVANANIVNAIRLVTLQKGHDPRDFTLVPFGGAGPMHAVDVARDLNIPEVLVPQFPGIASAFGQLHVDLRHDFTLPLFQRQSQVNVGEFNDLWSELEQTAHEVLVSEEGISAENVRLERQADLKYYPQSFYLTLPINDGEVTQEQLDELFASYHETHEREFGYSIPPHAAEVEIGQVRLVALGLIDKPTLSAADASANGSGPPGKRQAYFEEYGGWMDVDAYVRDEMSPGATIEGPAVIDQFDSTTVLPPETSAKVDDYANLLVQART